MEKFANGEVKILVCTHIIESGIDIANANTMIVQFAELFGLAQLYQVAFFLVLLCVLSRLFSYQSLDHISTINYFMLRWEIL